MQRAFWIGVAVGYVVGLVTWFFAAFLNSIDDNTTSWRNNRKPPYSADRPENNGKWDQ